MSWPPTAEKIQQEVNSILEKHSQTAEAKGKGKGGGKSAADFPPDVAMSMYAAHLLVRAAGGDSEAPTFESPVNTPFIDDEVKGALRYMDAQMKEKPDAKEKLSARGMFKVLECLKEQNPGAADVLESCDSLLAIAKREDAGKGGYAEVVGGAKADGKGDSKGKGKGKPAMTWDYVKEHMNEDHADSLLAYAIHFGGIADADKAVLTDLDNEAFFVSVELSDGSKTEVKIPYEGGAIDGIDGVGKVMVAMSKKARDEVFVTCAPDVTDRVVFQAFNDRNKDFKEKCEAKDWAGLAELYAEDAVLVPNSAGPPEANAPIVFGRTAIKTFFESKGEALLCGITVKSMRLLQKSDTEVTEIGRAWGATKGRQYCRVWRRVGDAWLLQHDCLPVGPRASEHHS